MKKIIFISLFTFSILLTGCSDDNIKQKTIPEQLGEIQEHFSEVLIQEDSEYGKLVFYSAENEEGYTGVGLSIFKDEDQDANWEYSDGAAHLFPTENVVSSLRINEDVMIVYAYVNNLPINESKLIKSEDIEDDTLLVTDSFISYTFIQPERELNVKFEKRFNYNFN
mgnify:CR=1 FL=1